MPSYHSPELRKTHKKPRPKSLAISTPTRLLSLEEARERALLGSFVKPDQKYIDVGGGPKNLPAKYHTVLDLHGYKKRGSKELVGKGKKSPGGFKSLFSKSRSGSIKQKGRKTSLQEPVAFDSSERKAITEEDVQHWKRRRIRGAKSAESLLSLPISSRLGSPLSESLDPNRLMNILAGKESSSPSKYRSMSVESTGPLTNSQDSSVTFPSFVLEDEGGREMAVDVSPEEVELELCDKGEKDSPEGIRRKQSFIRNEQKRKVICHRRTPSAPSAPRHDGIEYSSSGKGVDDLLQHQNTNKDMSVSQPMLEVTLTSKPPKGSPGKIGTRQDRESDRFLIHSDTIDGASASDRPFDDSGPEKRKGSKTPPKDRKKLKEAKDKSPSVERAIATLRERCRMGTEKENMPVDFHHQKSELIADLPESPGSKRKFKNNSASKVEESHSASDNNQVSLLFKSPYFFSRYHDYAEINDQDLDDSESQVTEKKDDKKEINNSDSAINKSSGKTKHYHVESINSVKAVESQCNSAGNIILETDFPMQRETEGHLEKAPRSRDNLKQSQSSDFASEIAKLEQGLHKINQRESSSAKSMTKCLSIPADIQKSLENIHSVSGSHSDIMSSVTISELSMSQDNVYPLSDSNGQDRRRRSTSLDGLHDDSPLSRTLREINAQIDKAFKQEKNKTQSLRDIQHDRHPQDDLSLSKGKTASELVSFEEDIAVTPTGHRLFGSMRDGNVEKDDQIQHNKYVDRPAAEIHIVDAPEVIRAPQRPERHWEGKTTPVTPTRPSPPDSLQIKFPVNGLSQQGNPEDANEKQTPVKSPYANVPTKMSEEDFQKLLLSDPDSVRQFEQSMLYSPVRARNKGFSDKDRSGRSSLASPTEGVIFRSRSNLCSPDASPVTLRGQPSNRGFGSPETSPLTGRPPRNPSTSSLEASPQSQQRRSQSSSSLESSPQSNQRQTSKVKPYSDVSPTMRQKLNQSYSSSEGSPQSRQKHNQSFSSLEASPPTQQKLNQSFGTSDGSPQSRQKLNQSSSSSDASPRQSHNKSFSSVDSSPRSQQKLNHSVNSSCETSPQTGARQKVRQHGATSPQVECIKLDFSPRSGRKPADSPQHERRGFVSPLPKIEMHRNTSGVSSPISPEHKQPRWEDLAGLNESFNEIDMAVFNDNYKKCLAPTGDSVRLSRNGSSEQVSSQTEPEVGTDSDTVVLERPSITRKAVHLKRQASFEKSSSGRKGAEIETYDNLPEHEAFELQHETARNKDLHITTERATFHRSSTMPTASSLPQSPVTGATSSGGFLEHSLSFESSSSVSNLYHGAPFDTSTGFREPGLRMSGLTTDRSGALRKSNTTPVLTRQTSFDSSYKKSVRVTSLGSSLEESDAECRSARSNVVAQGQGSFVTRSSNEINQAEFNARGFSRSSSHQSNQSSVLLRSESGQSADLSYPDLSQSSRADQNSSQSSIGTLLPQMLEEMDVNESCLGLASHQNMSNEMKEMMQEQMKEHAGILSPLDEVMVPFSGITSPRNQQRSFFDSDPLLGFDMESSIEVPSDVGLVNLPEIHLQIITDGPVMIATPMVLSQLTPEPRVHQPIDNTEEAFQNAVNDDLERNRASIQSCHPPHVTVCEPRIDRSERLSGESFVSVVGSTIPERSPGLEHLVAVSTDTVMVMDTPAPVMQDSMSSSTSSQVDLMSTSFTYPQNFDSWHYYSPMVNSLSLPGDLAPPPLEMIETCKSTMVKSSAQPEKSRKSAVNVAEPNEILIAWEYPKILDENRQNEIRRILDSSSSNTATQRDDEHSAQDRHKKKPENSKKPGKLPFSFAKEAVDSDQGENSGSEDDVFIDPSEVTPETSFYAAGSKYFQRRDFLSYGHYPKNSENQVNAEPHGGRVFSFDIPPRCSLDETVLRNRETGGREGLADFPHDLMDIGHDSSEDIRFSKAHRSSKLLTLCEKFEKEPGSASPTETDETSKRKMITPPEKNIVSSIRQMHESLEREGKEGTPGSTSKIQKPQKLSCEENKGKSGNEDSFGFKHANLGTQGQIGTQSSDSASKATTGTARSIPTLQGKPPLGRTKPRTASESSQGETESGKGTKLTKAEGSPKSRVSDGSPKSRTSSGSPKLGLEDLPKSKYDRSPKSQRQSYPSSDEGSPRQLLQGSSPKGQRYSTEVSPKLASKAKEGPPVLPKHSGSPTAQRNETTSKIPVFRQNSFSKDDKSDKMDQSSKRTSGSSVNARHSWGSVEKDIPARIRKNSDKDKEEPVQKENQASHKQSDTVVMRHSKKASDKCDQDKKDKKKRRGSIKELTNIFEEKIENISKSAAASPTQVKLRSRVRSVSPNSVVNKSPTMPSKARHSVELPVRDTDVAFKSVDVNIKHGSVRMGPKPFYGAK